MANNLDTEMDMVMPLKLNFSHRKTTGQEEGSSVASEVGPAHHSSSAESTSPAKKVLGPTQAKKRLLAFAQQWNKTKENLEHDKALEKHVNEHGTLKYTYLVERDDGKKISFPAHLIKYTNTEPTLSYCPNPHLLTGVFQSRKDVLEKCSQEEKQIMYFIMNGSSASCHDREFLGRYRKWYASRRAFVGKPGEEETPERYSPHWESDSDEEPVRTGCNSWTSREATPTPRLLSNPIKIVSKVKINKVELPFFEDDDFLESLLACQKTGTKEESKRNSSEAAKPGSSFDKSIDSNQPTPDNATPSARTGLDWSFEEDKDEQQPERRRRRSTPDWDEEWRSSSRYQDRRNNRDPDESRSKRSRRSSPRRDEGRRRTSSRASPRNKDEADVSMASEDWIADSAKDCSVVPEEEPDEMLDDASSKRLSLDQRLELELGIKIESDTYQISRTSPLPEDQRSHDDSPMKRRSAFGPIAAPIDALIFQCPKAIPAQPYIPPHLQNRLVRPLNRALPPSKEDKNKADNDDAKNQEEKDSEPSTEEEPRKKNWDKELKHLEALACNLEAADDSVWQELEEKLLLFEAANILPSSSESPLPAEQESNESGLKDTVIELKEAGKGILVMPRVSLMLDGTGASQKKAVMFADSIRPGYGSSSEEDDLPPARSPPPPPVVQPSVEVEKTKKKKKVKKQKKPKFTGPDYDPIYDLMPPPPPPPGSPPPHLPQGRSLSTSPPPLIEAAIPFIDNSPRAVDPGAA